MHWPIDVHMDHVMSTAATLKALEMAKLRRAPELILHEETWRSKNFSVHRLVDITSVRPQKVEIIRTCACQNVNGGIVTNKYRDAKFRGVRSSSPAKTGDSPRPIQSFRLRCRARRASSTSFRRPVRWPRHTKTYG